MEFWEKADLSLNIQDISKEIIYEFGGNILYIYYCDFINK